MKDQKYEGRSAKVDLRFLYSCEDVTDKANDGKPQMKHENMKRLTQHALENNS